MVQRFKLTEQFLVLWIFISFTTTWSWRNPFGTKSLIRYHRKSTRSVYGYKLSSIYENQVCRQVCLGLPRPSLWMKTDDSLAESLVNESPLLQLLLEFDCTTLDSEELSEFMLELGCLSVSVEVLSEKPDVLKDERTWEDLQKTKSWKTAILRANFPSSFDIDGVVDQIKMVYSDISDYLLFRVESVREVDWVKEIQKDWKPQIIDDLIIKFPWHNEENFHLPSDLSLSSTSLELVLEGGAAFGTGDHPTTRMCCRWLSRILRPTIIPYSMTGLDSIKAEEISKTVLDYGCGSGILGLAALRFGATRAVGVDIDRDALTSADNNCKMNSLNMELYVVSQDNSENTSSEEERSYLMNNRRGSGHNAVDFKDESVIHQDRFDVTVANILAPILISLAPTLAMYTKPGGRIALSGIINKQATAIISSYEPYFHSLQVEEEEMNWVVITGVRTA